MNYDDHHYSEINPETLAHQDPSEIILTIWAALRPCREITGPNGDRPENKWITWAQPKRFNPDCGLRAFVPGRWWGKRVFAEVAFNIIGDEYEISVWRSGHDGVLVFSTRDDGPILSPEARLKAAVSQMRELTRLFDKWSRDGTLEEDYPQEWIGESGNRMAQRYFAYKLIGPSWNGEGWRDLIRTAFLCRLRDEKTSIEFRSKDLSRRRGWRMPLARIATASGSFLLLLFGYLFAGWMSIILLAAISVSSWQSLVLVPLSIAFVLWSLDLALRHTFALWTIFARTGQRLLLISAVATVNVLMLWLGVLIAMQPTSNSDGAASQKEVMQNPVRDAALGATNFPDRFEGEVWLTDMARRLESQVPNLNERLEILRAVHFEATRVELPPELILAVIEVESGFDRYAISVDGEIGLMQIAPFWLDEIGRPDDNLLNIDTNLRYGCTILRFYFDDEEGDLRRALARYDGSPGARAYPNRVIDKLSRKWFAANYTEE